MIVRFRGISIKVNARDHNPPHCHVEGSGGRARFNLVALEWMDREGFTKADRLHLKEVILRRLNEIWAVWKELHDEK